MKKAIKRVLLPAAFSLCVAGCTGPLSPAARNPQYEKTFDWVVRTFEENDAGFKYYQKEKGDDDCRKHTEAYRKKIGSAATEREFLTLTNEWLYYFRKGHIGFRRKTIPLPTEAQRDSIRELYREEETGFGESDFKSYLDRSADSIDRIEGIWESPQYTIAVVRSEKDPNRFDAFVLATANPYWFPKQKKAELTRSGNGAFEAVFRMWDHSETNATAKLSGNRLSMLTEWIKTYPLTPYSARDSITLKSMSNKPFMTKVGPKTVYLRIPSFKDEQKPAIDSVLARGDRLLRSTPNLIVDIRNGTGGSDYSYHNLLPYVYTQPIRYPGQRYYTTEFNTSFYEKLAKESTDSAGARWNRRIAQAMRDTLATGSGKYPELLPARFIDSFEPSKYPSRVAVLCNRQNASADEAFLYDLRQSYKVKIFGEPTAGMFDFSNVSTADSPDGKYTLYMTRTVSNRYPAYKVDDIGIQPDFYIDDGIEDWIGYAQSVIEAQ